MAYGVWEDGSAAYGNGYTKRKRKLYEYMTKGNGKEERHCNMLTGKQKLHPPTRERVTGAALDVVRCCGGGGASMGCITGSLYELEHTALVV